MSEEASDVTKALAAFGAPSIRYHSFGPAQVRPSNVVLPRRPSADAVAAGPGEPLYEQAEPIAAPEPKPVTYQPYSGSASSVPLEEPQLRKAENPVLTSPHTPTAPPRPAPLFPATPSVAPPPRPLAEWAAPIAPIPPAPQAGAASLPPKIAPMPPPPPHSAAPIPPLPPYVAARPAENTQPDTQAAAPSVPPAIPAPPPDLPPPPRPIPTLVAAAPQAAAAAAEREIEKSQLTTTKAAAKAGRSLPELFAYLADAPLRTP